MHIEQGESIDFISSVQSSRIDTFFTIAIFIVGSIAFSALSAYFYQHNFFHLRTISYAEKARLAVEGVPPRLENIGFAYPPLPVMVYIAIPVVWLAQGIVSSAVFSLTLYIAKKFYGRYLYMFASLILFLPFLYLAIFRFDMLLLFFLLSISTLLLLKYWEERFSLYLFTGGLLFGLTFFLNFSTIYLIPIYALSTILKKNLSMKEKLGVTIVFLSPIVFFFTFTLFINYIFKNDALYFLKKYTHLYLQNLPAVQAKSTISNTLIYLFRFIKNSFVLVLPYFVGLLFVEKWREFYLSPFFLIYITPLVLSFFQMQHGMFSFSLSNSTLFMLFTLLFINRMRKRGIVIAAIALSIILAPQAFMHSTDKNEKNFASAIMGKPFEKNLTVFKKVAHEIDRLKGKILLDDKPLFPSVLFTKDIKRLILPYQYEFYTVLANPKGKVDYVIGVINSSNDDVYHTYPEIKKLRLDRCKFYRRIENVVFFDCKSNSAY